MMCGLFHYGLRATDPDVTRNFYTRLLDMRIDDSRPPMSVTGYWLRAAVPGSPPSIHVFTGDYASLEVGGAEVPVGMGAVHHMALYCRGFQTVRRKLEEYGLRWEGVISPRSWVLFVHDPNGVMLELAFDAVAEGGPAPELPPQNTYRPGVPFHGFEPGRYGAFSA
ncbi:MAG: VOC family protein [Lautropia sp.]